MYAAAADRFSKPLPKYDLEALADINGHYFRLRAIEQVLHRFRRTASSWRRRS
jgi:hypothetical protein